MKKQSKNTFKNQIPKNPNGILNGKFLNEKNKVKIHLKIKKINKFFQKNFKWNFKWKIVKFFF